jgi:RNA polymerase sigma-70 factor (ECF subfamily)
MLPRRGVDGLEAWDWTLVSRWCETETRRVLGRGAAAEDAAQEAVIRAWRRRGQCRSSGAQRAWVAAIARNEALRAASGRRDEVAFAEDRVDAASPSCAAEAGRRLDLLSAVRGLEESERRLLGLRYWADLTQAEAAERLGLPEGTVKVRLHRLRTKLRSQMA